MLHLTDCIIFFDVNWLISLSPQTLQATLNRAAVMVQQQDSERQEAQQRLMESLHGVEGRIGDVWSQLEHSVQQLVQRQNQAVHLQVRDLSLLNQCER